MDLVSRRTCLACLKKKIILNIKNILRTIFQRKLSKNTQASFIRPGHTNNLPTDVNNLQCKYLSALNIPHYKKLIEKSLKQQRRRTK